MFNNFRKYLDFFGFSVANRIYKGYVRVADISGIFAYAKMGDWQESAMTGIYCPRYRAISFVEWEL